MASLVHGLIMFKVRTFMTNYNKVVSDYQPKDVNEAKQIRNRAYLTTILVHLGAFVAIGLSLLVTALLISMTIKYLIIIIPLVITAGGAEIQPIALKVMFYGLASTLSFMLCKLWVFSKFQFVD